VLWFVRVKERLLKSGAKIVKMPDITNGFFKN